MEDLKQYKGARILNSDIWSEKIKEFLVQQTEDQFEEIAMNELLEPNRNMLEDHIRYQENEIAGSFLFFYRNNTGKRNMLQIPEKPTLKEETTMDQISQIVTERLNFKPFISFAAQKFISESAAKVGSGNRIPCELSQDLFSQRVSTKRFRQSRNLESSLSPESPSLDHAEGWKNNDFEEEFSNQVVKKPQLSQEMEISNSQGHIGFLSSSSKVPRILSQKRLSDKLNEPKTTSSKRKGDQPLPSKCYLNNLNDEFPEEDPIPENLKKIKRNR